VSNHEIISWKRRQWSIGCVKEFQGFVASVCHSHDEFQFVHIVSNPGTYTELLISESTDFIVSSPETFKKSPGAADTANPQMTRKINAARTEVECMMAATAMAKNEEIWINESKGGWEFYNHCFGG
jgi:hypothetical protein